MAPVQNVVRKEAQEERPEDTNSRALTVMFSSSSGSPGPSLWYKALSLLLEAVAEPGKVDS